MSVPTLMILVEAEYMKCLERKAELCEKVIELTEPL
jgi:hypothetical protein